MVSGDAGNLAPPRAAAAAENLDLPVPQAAPARARAFRWPEVSAMPGPSIKEIGSCDWFFVGPAIGPRTPSDGPGASAGDAPAECLTEFGAPSPHDNP